MGKKGRPPKDKSKEEEPKTKVESSDAAKIKMLNAIGTSLDKSWNRTIVQSLESMSNTNVDVISSGSLALDLATGIGGLPRGRIIEIYGNESVGKTTLIMGLVREVQKLGETAVFIDAENGYNNKYGQDMDIDYGAGKFILNQPENAEEAVDVALSYVASGHVGLIVVDSIAALSSMSEQVRESKKNDVIGVQARLVGTFIRKINPLAFKTNTLVCCINQNRAKVTGYGGTTTPGGRALKFFSAMRVSMYRAKTLQVGENEPYGIRTGFKTEKNKLAAPFRTGEFDIIFGQGISRAGEIIDYGIQLGLIQKTSADKPKVKSFDDKKKKTDGNTYMWDDVKLGVGRNQAVHYLNEHKDEMEKIEKGIREIAFA